MKLINVTYLTEDKEEQFATVTKKQLELLELAEQERDILCLQILNRKEGVINE